MFCLVLTCYDSNIEDVSKHFRGWLQSFPGYFLKGDCSSQIYGITVTLLSSILKCIVPVNSSIFNTLAASSNRETEPLNC
jgi:hypothetical protein